MSRIELPYVFTPTLNAEVRAGRGPTYEMLVRNLAARHPGEFEGRIRAYLRLWAWPPAPPETAAAWWPEKLMQIPAVVESAGAIIPILMEDPVGALLNGTRRSATRAALAEQFGHPRQLRLSAAGGLSELGNLPTTEQVDTEVERLIRAVSGAGKEAPEPPQQTPKPPSLLSLESMSQRGGLAEHWLSWLQWCDNTMQRAEQAQERGPFEAAAHAWTLLQVAMICPEGPQHQRVAHLQRWVEKAPLARIRSCWFLLSVLYSFFMEGSRGQNASEGLAEANILRKAREGDLPQDVMDDIRHIMGRRPPQELIPAMGQWSADKSPPSPSVLMEDTSKDLIATASHVRRGSLDVMLTLVGFHVKRLIVVCLAILVVAFVGVSVIWTFICLVRSRAPN